MDMKSAYRTRELHRIPAHEMPTSRSCDDSLRVLVQSSALWNDRPMRTESIRSSSTATGDSSGFEDTDPPLFESNESLFTYAHS